MNNIPAQYFSYLLKCSSVDVDDEGDSFAFNGNATLKSKFKWICLLLNGKVFELKSGRSENIFVVQDYSNKLLSSVQTMSKIRNAFDFSIKFLDAMIQDKYVYYVEGIY